MRWLGGEVEETAGSVRCALPGTWGHRQCGDVRAFHVQVEGSCQGGTGPNMSDSLRATSTSSLYTAFVALKSNTFKNQRCHSYSLGQSRRNFLQTLQTSGNINLQFRRDAQAFVSSYGRLLFKNFNAS